VAVLGGGFWPIPQANEIHMAKQHAKARSLLASGAQS
jgi:hypothetical protein